MHNKVVNDLSPLISVVIPVYNRAHLIARTLQSVALQSYKNLEVIVVDDCSKDSDALVAELNKFTDLNIIYIRHEINRHGGAARNTGIDKARGQYIAFLDSDDAWVAEKINDCLQEITKHQVDFVFGQLHVLKDDKLYPARGPLPDERLSDFILLNGGTIQTSTLFINAELAKRVRFDDALKRFQDYDFVVSLEQAGARCHFIKHCHALMYDDDQGNRISNSYDPEPAINWVEKVKDNISAAAYVNFYLTRIVKYQKMHYGGIVAIVTLFSDKLINLDLSVKAWWLLICITPRKLICFAQIISSTLSKFRI